MPDKLFHLQEWTPKLTTIAQELTEEIHSVAPELEVLFMGAAALGLPGKNDIDLDVLCAARDIARYTQILAPILGNPQKTSDTMMIWEFVRDAFDIDCILSDPTISHVPQQRQLFELLHADSHLRKQYERIKRGGDGLSYAEYEKRKEAFFAGLPVGDTAV